jgi:bla regulator protein blaR1
MRLIGIVGTLAITFDLMAAQAPKPHFDVASIKPTSVRPLVLSVPIVAQPFMTITFTGGRLVAKNATLRALAQFAYGNASASPFAALYTIVGGPAFIDQDRYDVEAKSENAVPLDTARVMLRSLLEERFALALHMDTRELPVYHLVIGKGGLKMKPLSSDEPGRMRIDPSARTASYAAPMSSIVSTAQGWSDRLVIDQTGLTGMFEQTLSDPPSLGGDTGSSAPARPLSQIRFEDSTGLRLIPAKEPVEVLVIDRAEKPQPN